MSGELSWDPECGLTEVTVQEAACQAVVYPPAQRPLNKSASAHGGVGKTESACVSGLIPLGGGGRREEWVCEQLSLCRGFFLSCSGLRACVKFSGA